MATREILCDLGASCFRAFFACHGAGKCMDFVHEDLSLMSQEMDRWRALRKAKVSREYAPATSFSTRSPERL